MKATLPYPPSANRYWRTFRGRTVVSAEARKYKVLVKSELAKWPLLEGPVALIAHLYRPQKSGDLDNRLKALGDALNGVAWMDDSQVVEIHAYRHDDKARPRVEVEVRSLGVEDVLPSLPSKGKRSAAFGGAPVLEVPHPASADDVAAHIHATSGEWDAAAVGRKVVLRPKGHAVTPAYQRAQTAAVVPKERLSEAKRQAGHPRKKR